MSFVRLSLENFRRFPKAQFSFAETGLTLILGPNGAGKSTILETIYLLCMGRTPRDVRFSSLVHRGSTTAYFRVEAERPSGPGRSVAYLNGSAVVYHEGDQTVRRSDLIGKPPVILFSADEMRIVAGEPALRRRMTDRILSQERPEYLARLKRYTRAVEERNALLRDDMPPDPGSWMALDETLAADGSEILSARRGFLRDVSADLPDTLKSLGSPHLAERIRIEPAETIRGEYLNALIDARPQDRGAGHTTVGPHRDDIRFWDQTLPAAETVSQGETRILSLALKLIESRRLAAVSQPILLCDDLFSELDGVRRDAVTAFLAAYPGQVLLTSCLALPDPLLAAVRLTLTLE